MVEEREEATVTRLPSNDVGDDIEMIAVPDRFVRVVNLSELYGQQKGKGGRTRFRINGNDHTIPLPGERVKAGKPVWMRDKKYLSPHTPPMSAFIVAYAKGAQNLRGENGGPGDGGLRDFDKLTEDEKRGLQKLEDKARMEMARTEKQGASAAK